MYYQLDSTSTLRKMFTVKRRTFQRLKHASEAKLHHHVYVVLLDPHAATDRKVLRENPIRDPSKPCLYVGLTGLTPAERFQNHKLGIKAARIVERYGLKLLPDLYEYLNPMPFEVTAQMEKELTEDLRNQGFTVAGGT